MTSSPEPTLAGDGAAHAGQYLSFTLAGEGYAVDILRVQEIRGWEPVRPLPQSAPCVKGVLDLRGTLVPVVDLRVRFDLPHADYTPTTVVVVMAIDDGHGGRRSLGVVVDGVSDVLDVSAQDLRPPPELGGAVARGYMLGMAKVDGRMVILLDIDGLFDPRELGTASL